MHADFVGYGLTIIGVIATIYFGVKTTHPKK
jgi:hypothetical protein